MCSTIKVSVIDSFPFRSLERGFQNPVANAPGGPARGAGPPDIRGSRSGSDGGGGGRPQTVGAGGRATPHPRPVGRDTDPAMQHELGELR
ncbi:hypothetical protein GCM10009834_03260 [Streptomonospora arabica]